MQYLLFGNLWREDLTILSLDRRFSRDGLNTGSIELQLVDAVEAELNRKENVSIVFRRQTRTPSAVEQNRRIY